MFIQKSAQSRSQSALYRSVIRAKGPAVVLGLGLCIGLLSPPALPTAPTGDVESSSLESSPDVTAAPGRGVQGVAGHSTLSPTLYDLDAQPVEQVSPLVQRQQLNGVQSTFVKWTVKKGGRFPLHHHANEQVTWITRGRCEVYSQNKRFVLTANRILLIPPNTPHEFVCTEDTVDIDFFAPQRQDWIDGAPSVASGQ